MEYKYNPSEIEFQEINDLREVIGQQLNLREKFKGCDEGAAKEIVEVIADHSLRASKLLGIDPKGFKFEIGDSISSDAVTYITTINSQRTYSIGFRTAEMGFSLRSIRNPVIGPFIKEVLLIRPLVHELYHLRQAKLFPRSIEKSSLAYNGFEKHLLDRGETAAEIFAMHYLANRDIPLHNLLQQETRFFAVMGQYGLLTAGNILKKANS